MSGKADFKKRLRFFKFAWVSYMLAAAPALLLLPQFGFLIVLSGFPLILYAMLALRCPGCGGRLFGKMTNIDHRYGAIEWRRKCLILFEPVRHRTCGADLK